MKRHLSDKDGRRTAGAGGRFAYSPMAGRVDEMNLSGGVGGGQFFRFDGARVWRDHPTPSHISRSLSSGAHVARRWLHVSRLPSTGGVKMSSCPALLAGHSKVSYNTIVKQKTWMEGRSPERTRIYAMMKLFK